MSLEVVDRGSETELQMAENLNFFAQCSKGLHLMQLTKKLWNMHVAALSGKKIKWV